MQPIQGPPKEEALTAFAWEDYHATQQEHSYTPLWQWGSTALI